MLSGFHARDGLMFERLYDGTVRVKREHPPGSGQLQVCVDIDPGTWASVVASMSLQGETSETHSAALFFHMAVQR